jgi:hypothetical protein
LAGNTAPVNRICTTAPVFTSLKCEGSFQAQKSTMAYRTTPIRASGQAKKLLQNSGADDRNARPEIGPKSGKMGAERDSVWVRAKKTRAIKMDQMRGFIGDPHIRLPRY